MAHFAELDDNNVVLRTIVVSNTNCLDSDGNESESVGKEFCSNLLGGRWVQTSYNRNMRLNFAGENFVYIESLDVFVGPKPYASWVIGSNKDWEAPILKPTDDKKYQWDELNKQWIELA